MKFPDGRHPLPFSLQEDYWDRLRGDPRGFAAAICEFIQAKYPDFPPLIVDGALTRKLVVLVNRRSALSMDGLDTPVDDSVEIIIMKYLGWA